MGLLMEVVLPVLIVAPVTSNLYKIQSKIRREDYPPIITVRIVIAGGMNRGDNIHNSNIVTLAIYNPLQVRASLAFLICRSDSMMN